MAKNKKKKEEEEEKETLTLSSDLTISDHFTLIISKGPAFFRLMVDGCDLRRSCLIRGNRVVVVCSEDLVDLEVGLSHDRVESLN
ncbi:hypothetical protein QQP08_001231 [Theobroma cacao]|nr:hypothetical protein QQP08_001231 [Theobroma cacao]